MSASSRLDSVARRVDDTRLDIINPDGVPVTLFANRDVPIELEAIEQALGFISIQREIPMSPRRRGARLRAGLWGLQDTAGDNAGTGLWRHYDPAAQERDLGRVHFQGVVPARELFAFGDYVRSSGSTSSRDSQIGSIGGGNHFVELQVVDEILDGSTAHAWGLARDTVAIMAHSGSVGL